MNWCRLGLREAIDFLALIQPSVSRPSGQTILPADLSEHLLLLRLRGGTLEVFYNPPNGVHLPYDEFIYFLQNLEN